MDSVAFEQSFNIYQEDFLHWSEKEANLAQAIKDKVRDKSRLSDEEVVRPEAEGGYEGGIIKVSLEQLPAFRVKNSPEKIIFSEKVLNFLKSKNANIAVVFSKKKRPEFMAAFLPIEKEDGYELDKIFIEENSPVGWTYFNGKGWSFFSVA